MIEQKKQYNGLTITDTGKVYRADSVEVTGTRIGKNGHIIMTIGGKTIYLARLVYCLFNGLDYDAFCGRIRYIGEYSDCSLKNIFVVSKSERKQSQPRRNVDPWKVRELFVAGLPAAEISEMTGVHEYRVKLICIGFENCDLEKFSQIIKILA